MVVCLEQLRLYCFFLLDNVRSRRLAIEALTARIPVGDLVMHLCVTM